MGEIVAFRTGWLGTSHILASCRAQMHFKNPHLDLPREKLWHWLSAGSGKASSREGGALSPPYTGTRFPRGYKLRARASPERGPIGYTTLHLAK